MNYNFEKLSLDYHFYPDPGKISVIPKKNILNQKDLSIAYSPGVSYACIEIYKKGNNESFKYTSRNNLVGVITNGTAVLGLGNIGPTASKPVMEGKVCLFKKFSNIDAFDIEIAELNKDKLIDIIISLEPTLGGVNLEDIKSPECFYIEKKLKENMNIPIFHDDQHGTAIVASAAILNGIKLVKKNISKVRLVCSGAGAAAISCLNLLVKIGLNKKNIFVLDSRGLISVKRKYYINEYKRKYSQDTDLVKLEDIIVNSDIFLGCSKSGILSKNMVKSMSVNPLILALANPDPEINPEDAKKSRTDCIIATGRSDYPNQVNNVLCFPFIFRGAIDSYSKCINEEMKIACVKSIASLVFESIEKYKFYNISYDTNLNFGKNYIIPKPFDPRLIIKISPSVAKASCISNVSNYPIKNIKKYRYKLTKSMKYFYNIRNIISKNIVKKNKKIIFSNGENENVLIAIKYIVDEKIAYPIIIGKKKKIREKSEIINLNLFKKDNLNIIDIKREKNFSREYINKTIMNKDMFNNIDLFKDKNKKNILVGLLFLVNKKSDFMICNVNYNYKKYLNYLMKIINYNNRFEIQAKMSIITLNEKELFVSKNFSNRKTTTSKLSDITILSAKKMIKFGVIPKIYLLYKNRSSNLLINCYKKISKIKCLIQMNAPYFKIDNKLNFNFNTKTNICDFNKYKKFSLKYNLLISLDNSNFFNTANLENKNNNSIGPIFLGNFLPMYLLESNNHNHIINMTILSILGIE